jgi:phosphate:Na+ symporter
MIREMIFGTVGGLGLFLFGMVLMSEGLKKAAGQKLKTILESMTKRTFVGFLVGAGVTAIIQASGATTVIVIGLVNAGLLTLKQAIGVIIGANVGTTATAWIVSVSGLALDITLYSLPIVGVGFLLYIGGRTRKMKSIGEIMLGFGVLFLGIGFMKDAFGPLEKSQRVQELFVIVGSRPLLALLIGMGLTILLQSSSAAIAIVQLLAMGGAFGTNWETALNVAIPFVLGGNIGTTITAQFAALQANRNAKRAAWAHTMFNVLGSAIAYPFVYAGLYSSFVLAVCPWELGGATVAATIAVAHSFFNIANSCIFLPLSPVLARVATWLVPIKSSEVALPPVVLEKHLLDTPEIAIDQARRQIVHMAKTAQRAFRQSIEGIMEDDRKKLSSAMEIEDIIDSLQFEITSYLSALSSRPLSDGISVRLPVLLHAVNDLERIGDHAVNIVEIAQRKIDQKISFSDQAMAEAEKLRKTADQMFDDVIAALENGDIRAAKAALAIERQINKAQVDFRRSHVQRMSEGVCTPETGLIFIDLVDNVEKIGDHLTNIAQAAVGGLQWADVEPKILDGLDTKTGLPALDE